MFSIGVERRPKNIVVSILECSSTLVDWIVLEFSFLKLTSVLHNGRLKTQKL